MITDSHRRAEEGSRPRPTPSNNIRTRSIHTYIVTVSKPHLRQSSAAYSTSQLCPLATALLRKPSLLSMLLGAAVSRRSFNCWVTCVLPNRTNALRSTECPNAQGNPPHMLRETDGRGQSMGRRRRQRASKEGGLRGSEGGNERKRGIGYNIHSYTVAFQMIE